MLRVIGARYGTIATIACLFCSIAGCQHWSTHRFEDVYRAGKAVQAATRDGATYAEFRRLALTFARQLEMTSELAQLKRRPISDADRRLLLLYIAAFDAYMDSLILGRKASRLSSGRRATTEHACKSNTPLHPMPSIVR